MAVPLKELGSKLSYQEVNDILKLYAAGTEPQTPYDGQIWLDTSSGALLKRYNGTAWDVVGEVTAADLLSLIQGVDGSGSGLDADKLDGQEGSYYQNASNLNAGTVPAARLSAGDLLTKIETVDGSGSGLDADKLDGLEGSQFVRNDANTDVNAHTEWQDNYQARFGNGADLGVWHDGSNSYVKSNLHGANVYHQAENSSGTSLNMLTLVPDFPKIETAGAVATHMYEKSLTNNEIFDTGIPRTAVGYFFIRNSAGGAANGCVFWVGMILTISNGVSRSGGSSSVWNTEKDNAGTINVYCESSGNLKVQNLSGTTRTFKMGFIGVNF